MMTLEIFLSALSIIHALALQLYLFVSETSRRCVNIRSCTEQIRVMMEFRARHVMYT